MWSIMLSVSFVAGMLVASLLWRREVSGVGTVKRQQGEQYPFVKTERLLNEQEVLLLHQLQTEIGQKKRVLMKVRLSSVALLPKRVERREFLMRLASTKQVDFLVVNDADFKPIVGIQMASRTNEDDLEIVSDIMDAIGLPLVTLPNKRQFEHGELNALIRETIQNRNGH